MILKQRRVGMNPVTHDPRANAHRETSLMKDLTAAVDGFLLTDEISHPTFLVVARM